MEKIKIGDIIINHAASERNPLKKTFIIEKSNSQVKCFTLDLKHKCTYMTNDVVDESMFTVVGHIILGEVA